jgi:hypothetical protein
MNIVQEITEHGHKSPFPFSSPGLHCYSLTSNTIESTAVGRLLTELCPEADIKFAFDLFLLGKVIMSHFTDSAGH